MAEERTSSPDCEEQPQEAAEQVTAEVVEEPAAEGPSLEDQIEALQQALAEAKESALREAAEAQNARRRAEKDVESARKFALEKFAGELLPVVDNLERAMELADTSNEQVKALVDGVALTHKSFIDALRKFQVEQLNPEGTPFDPQHHQAMSMVENPDCEPNTVLAVMQKGFLLNGRLLRPAMVVVSKAASPGVDTTA